jgi:hypothetical protein
MAPRTRPPVTDDEVVADSPDPDATSEEPDAPSDAADRLAEFVTARYVGVDPVLAVFAGAQVIIEPGDPIVITGEQLAQQPATNPVFVPWED